MESRKVGLTLAVLFVVGLAGALGPGAARATSYALTTTVTTDGVVSSDGGSLSIFCQPAGGGSWTSCGSSVASGTSVSIDAVRAEGYWFLWFATSQYLAGCTTTNWGWGYSSNPETHCGFTMPASAVSLRAEFQLP
jgi:hypothetical protein